MCGIAAGLGVAFWIGFGGPKPVPQMLPVSTEGCPADGFVNGTSLLTRSSEK